MNDNAKESKETKWFRDLLAKKEWIVKNEAHFKENCRSLYDEGNFKRMERFADAPLGYINERIELNKEVSRGYHKFHTTILLAGFTSVYAYFLTHSIMAILNAIVNANEVLELRIVILLLNIGILIFLVILALIASRIHLPYRILKHIGLLRVIRDSEIEIYYLMQIKEHRKSLEANKSKQ